MSARDRRIRSRERKVRLLQNRLIPRPLPRGEGAGKATPVSNAVGRAGTSWPAAAVSEAAVAEGAVASRRGRAVEVV